MNIYNVVAEDEGIRIGNLATRSNLAVHTSTGYPAVASILIYRQSPPPALLFPLVVIAMMSILTSKRPSTAQAQGPAGALPRHGMLAPVGPTGGVVLCLKPICHGTC